MKRLLLFVSMVCSIHCYSQNPNPQLFQTWYLVYVQNNDFATPINVAAIEPPIAPTLTISDDLTFTGEAACNTYSGTFSNATADFFQTTQFSQSALVCSSPAHSSFETSYLDFLQSVQQYVIIALDDMPTLSMFSPLMGQAIFQNMPLKTKDFDSGRISVFPNPAHATVFLNFKSLEISKIQLINALGQSVKTISHDFESIDIADLTSGVYVLKIDTGIGTINRKIVKE